MLCWAPTAFIVRPGHMFRANNNLPRKVVLRPIDPGFHSIIWETILSPDHLQRCRVTFSRFGLLRIFTPFSSPTWRWKLVRLLLHTRTIQTLENHGTFPESWMTCLPSPTIVGTPSSARLSARSSWRHWLITNFVAWSCTTVGVNRRPNCLVRRCCSSKFTYSWDGRCPGCAQAIENGATIGILLGNANREDIPVALRAYQRLR